MVAILYFTVFAVIAGSAFGLMYANIKAISMMNDPIIKRHPEAPEAGEEVMYVDVSEMNSSEFQHEKERLENLYNKE
tara:strand:+ start:114 stop:344 length:231 start_codon:yes stop_codon:yes gene_type:complete